MTRGVFMPRRGVVRVLLDTEMEGRDEEEDSDKKNYLVLWMGKKKKYTGI